MTTDLRHVRLQEHGPPVEVELTPAERDGLLALKAKLELAPSPGSGKVWRMRATDRVGLLRVGDLVVEIRPKLPIERLLYLLGFAAGVPELRSPLAAARETPDLLEAMAWIYAGALRTALRRGLPHGYVHVEEDSLSVRGRIAFEDQISRRAGNWLPIAVRFDDFTEDTELNRLLKAALRRLLLLPLANRAAVHEMRRWLRVFGSVSDLPLGLRRLPKPRLSRLEAHLEPAAAIAGIVLRGGSVEPTAGAAPSPCLVLDMAWLFERFVRESLRLELGLTRAMFPEAGGGGLYLDRGRQIGLRPDLLWRDGNRFLFVGDVKYKLAQDGRGRRADLYQLLAYAVRMGLDRGLLIHATAQDQRVHQVECANLALIVAGIDLSAPIPLLRQQVSELAGIIRMMAQRSEVKSLAHPRRVEELSEYVRTVH